MKVALVATTLVTAAFTCCCGSPWNAVAPPPPDDEAPVPRAPTSEEQAGGRLTAQAIVASANAVATFQPWEPALAVMTGRLGPPTHVEGDRYAWAVMDGDTCVSTWMEVMGNMTGGAEAQVGSYQMGAALEKNEESPYYARCVADVAAPPTGEARGAASDAMTIHAFAAGHPAIGSRVTVHGYVGSTNGNAWPIVDEVGETLPFVFCEMATPPVGVAKGAHVEASGEVVDVAMLKNCVITAL